MSALPSAIGLSNLAAAPSGGGNSHTNAQLQLLFQGWMAIALLACIASLGLLLIVVLIAVGRRRLQREKRLESEIREVRSSLSAIGDAWAASATRIPGFAPRHPPEDDDDEDDEDDEPDDPYNLFGGRDPLDGVDDEDDGPDDDSFSDEDDDRPPPGFR
ncbi:MAG: hypothetical protein AAGH92_12240 [Planctomycetota bacterium]